MTVLGKDFRVGQSVTVEPFCIAENETTVAQYGECVAAGACNAIFGEQSDPTYPIHSVAPQDVELFLNWLSTRYERDYRLPSEAEWQIAALGGVEDRNHDWTQGANVLSGELMPTGVNAPNGYGLRDTVGNLAELVADCRERNSLRVPVDGSPFRSADCRYLVVKGGHHSMAEWGFSPYFELPLPLDSASPQVGFRIVRAIGRMS